MNTEKLYYSDPFMQEFTAVVLSCEPTKGGSLVVLDRTAFYPEGGGQPADHGTLNGLRVTDVHEKDGVIFHTVAGIVENGTTVTGTIDWARRFDHMQQHSGEHILSGILCADYDCDNVGFHMGADTVTIDYNAELSWEQCLAAEAKANAVIYADVPCEISFPSGEELAALNYRSKKELSGAVRIVRFPEADCCACCGTHVLRAGQVGLVKVLSCQKFRSGVRMEILCGQRAFRYLSHCYDQARAVGQKLSVKPTDIQRAVEKLEKDLADAKLRMAGLEGRAWEAMAKDHAGEENVLIFESPMAGDSLRRLADAVGHHSKGLTAVFAGEGRRWAYALLRADGQELSAFVKELNAALHGRGGGRNGFAQGSVETTREEIEAFFAK